jgi:hypothetical protein
MSPPEKPFSQACENNKQPIFQVICDVFKCPSTIWEIGSGTGQHACFFAAQMPCLTWQPTDLPDNLPGIRWRLDEADLANIRPPLALDVSDERWPCTSIQGLFTANTLHIMSFAEVRLLFGKLQSYLDVGAFVAIYGPFNYKGRFTSDSNAHFDQWLKNRNPQSGIRDFEDICRLAQNSGLQLVEDHAMPANNRLLILQKMLNRLSLSKNA